MAAEEQSAFRRALGVAPDAVRPFDLLSGAPSPREFADADAVLIGGSGDYSVVRGGAWLPAALSAMETLFETAKPTFASCWGFQALARALGGRVVTDHARAEVGVLPLHLTEAGLRDPVFGPIGTPFHAVIGHEDIVDELPPGAVSLASSDNLPNEAFTFPDKTDLRHPVPPRTRPRRPGPPPRRLPPLPDPRRRLQPRRLPRRQPRNRRHRVPAAPFRGGNPNPESPARQPSIRPVARIPST